MRKRMTNDLSIAILGASGFGGGELLRLLAAHPNVGQVQALANKQAGRSIAKVHPHLRGAYPGTFGGELVPDELDVLFAALPHGEFCKRWHSLRTQLDAKTHVIDLSGDFRLQSAAEFELAYGGAHPCPEFLAEFDYGLPESRHLETTSSGQSAQRIANPGCFATAISLALLPISAICNGIELHFSISAVTGSSGSGAALSDGTHHPTRAHDFRAYKVFAHQHEFEVRQQLRSAAQHFGNAAPRFSLIPHSAPMVRGIYVSAQTLLPAALAGRDFNAAFADFYRNSPFIRVIDDAVARTAAVVGSNYCDINVIQHGQQLAILVTLDNLLKGMAGQAVQNMNIALGLPETTGLTQLGLFP
jgi:LysW-gamma-L-alpha-aminoadipyl-6-phosphate/LysW-L-glutamyl-5-phosphate reductase